MRLQVPHWAPFSSIPLTVSPGIFLLCPSVQHSIPLLDSLRQTPGSQQTPRTPLSGLFLLSFLAMEGAPLQGRPSLVSPCLLLSSHPIYLSPLAVSLARLLTLSPAPQAHSVLPCRCRPMKHVTHAQVLFPTTFLAYSTSSGESLSPHLLRQDSCFPTTNGTLYATFAGGTLCPTPMLVGLNKSHPLGGTLHRPLLI